MTTRKIEKSADPVIVDSSIWSLAFRRKNPAQLNTSERSLVGGYQELVRALQVRIIGPIRQEILSGIRSTDTFRKMRDLMRAFPDEELTMVDYEYAAELSRSLSEVGLAYSAVGLIICSATIQRRWLLYTCDANFERYSRFLPLRLYRVSG